MCVYSVRNIVFARFRFNRMKIVIQISENKNENINKAKKIITFQFKSNGNTKFEILKGEQSIEKKIFVESVDKMNL